MFKIGEFSKLSQVSIRMLRHYDEVGLLRPAVVDESSGYRLYSSEQIPRLNRIVFLRDIGFGVSGIAQVLESWDSAAIEDHLAVKKSQIEEAIKIEQAKLLRIERAYKDIQEKGSVVSGDVIIRSIPGCLVLSMRRVVPNYYAEGHMWKEMAAFIQAEDVVHVNQDTFTIYHDNEYCEDQVDIEICLPVPQAGKDSGGFVFREVEAEPYMACSMVYGPFENIAGAYYSFASWLQGHSHYEMTGQSRQLVHRGPWNEEDPQSWVTEIQIPLRKI